MKTVCLYSEKSIFNREISVKNVGHQLGSISTKEDMIRGSGPRWQCERYVLSMIHIDSKKAKLVYRGKNLTVQSAT